MRRLCIALGVTLVLSMQSGAAAEPSVENSPYPGAVALGTGADGGWDYKSFPQLLPLYVFKGEPAGRSLCDRDCTAVWPIIRAEETDKPVGSWTIVKRDDGRFQWAYKNRAVYAYFEDRPNEPKGAGKSMDWYLDERGVAYLKSAGVELSGPLVEGPAKNAKKIQATAELLKP